MTFAKVVSLKYFEINQVEFLEIMFLFEKAIVKG
jgi:hypothetical protein